MIVDSEPGTTGQDTRRAHDLHVLDGLRALHEALDGDWRRRARSLAATGREIFCLTALAQHEGTSQKTLAELLGISASTVTRLVDYMEAKGLVRRIRDAGDRRRLIVCLTVAGRRVADQAADSLELRLAARIRALPPREAAALSRAVRCLVGLVQDEARAD